MVPFLGISFGSSVLEIGTAFSVLIGAQILSRPLVGMLSDRIGRKTPLVVGSLLRVASLGLFAMSVCYSSMIIVIGARALQGVSASFFWVSCYALVADETTKDNRGLVMGRLTQSASQGQFLGSFPGFFIASYSLPLAFLFYAVVACASIFYTLKISEKEVQSTSQEQSASKLFATGGTLLLMMFCCLCAVSFIDDFAKGIVGPFTQIFLMTKFGIQDLPILAMLSIPAGIIYSIAPAHFGRLSDKHGRTKLILPALILSPITTFVIAFVPTFSLVVLMWVLYAIAWAAADTSFDALVGDIVQEKRGTAYGIYTGLELVGAMTGPLVGSLAWITSPETPFLLSALLLASSIPAFIAYSMFVRHKDRS
jgi:DHA1 family multidrug resistance protein-like MFS transporter